jgi:flagellar basal-body rod protein FlgC
MIGALDTSRSALVAQRTRLDVIAGNIANAFTTAREDGRIEPFRRRFVTLGAGTPEGGPGVRVTGVFEDPSDYALRYDPGHPHALREGPLAGYVQYPNVSLTTDYVDALEASRAYELNLAMMNLTRQMIQQAVQLFA